MKEEKRNRRKVSYRKLAGRIGEEVREIPAVVAVIGGGPAGMEAAHVLANGGCEVLLFEARPDLAANLTNKYRLFPNFADAADIAGRLTDGLDHPRIRVLAHTEVVRLEREDETGEWRVETAEGDAHRVSAVLMATGYEVFDAHRKEELGYGIYDSVITSVDLEAMLKQQRVLTPLREDPRRIVFLQCVGSRDEKVGNRYCSKVCCVTAVKQAIEVKRLLPEVEAYVFYMDLRMWGQTFEELYRTAQEQYGIRFVRGRISEAAGTFDGQVQVKAEDTLIGQQIKMTADLLVLMVGMEASCGTRRLAGQCDIAGEYGFARSMDPHLYDNLTQRRGLFLAGTCKRPMSLTDVINDARSAAMEIINYLS